MKIALAQTNIIWEEKEKNIKKAEEWIALAKERKAALICFPEMSFTGFSMNTKLTAEKDKETVRKMRKIAEKTGIAIGFGWVWAGDPLCENRYSIVNEKGEEVLDYAKIHPFSYSEENLYFKGGEDLFLCRIGDMEVSTAICYDLRFPEIFQKISEKARLIIVPANWPKIRREHWMTLLAARAIENQCYIAGINCCGSMNQTDYSGDSALYAPDGTVIEPGETLAMGNAEEKLLLYEFENNADSVRKGFPVRADRREDLYRKIEVKGREK